MDNLHPNHCSRCGDYRHYCRRTYPVTWWRPNNIFANRFVGWCRRDESICQSVVGTIQLLPAVRVYFDQGTTSLLKSEFRRCEMTLLLIASQTMYVTTFIWATGTRWSSTEKPHGNSKYFWNTRRSGMKCPPSDCWNFRSSHWRRYSSPHDRM